MFIRRLSAFVFAIVSIAPAPATVAQPRALHGPEPAVQSTRAEQSATFELNVGQADRRVRSIARGPKGDLLVTDDGFAIATGGAVVRATFTCRGSAVSVMGHEPLHGTSHYLTGSDSSAWLREVPQFASLRSSCVWDGIDVVWHSTDGAVEYDFVVAPQANPSTIRMSFDGADSMAKTLAGDLVLSAGGARIVQRAPVAYQVVDGMRRRIPSTFTFIGDREVGFSLGAYDTTLPLVIDPVVEFSTYLGGSHVDRASALFVDAEGAVYVAGATTSIDFPLAGTGGPASAAGVAFVSKFAPDGKTLVYSTYVGGGPSRYDVSIAVDAAGRVYVAGTTADPDFPVFNAVQPVYGGGARDAFALALTPDGSDYVFATFLGGTADDYGTGLALDASGAIYIAGRTESTTGFPTVGAYQRSLSGAADGFVTKLSPSGAAIVSSTYLGGFSTDSIEDIAVDDAGHAYVCGSTKSINFPVRNAYDRDIGGTAIETDAFVTKFAASGASLEFSTYLGGVEEDVALAIDVDELGRAVLGGGSYSSDFPTRNAIKPRNGRPGSYQADAFILRMTTSGTALDFSTFYGGDDREDYCFDLTLEPGGAIAFCGGTYDKALPLVAPVLDRHREGNGYDGFVARIDSSASELLFSTYLGGTGDSSEFDDFALAIAAHAPGVVTVAGVTEANDFPLVNAYDTRGARTWEQAWVTRIAMDGVAADLSIVLETSARHVYDDESFTALATVSSTAISPERDVEVRLYVPNTADASVSEASNGGIITHVEEGGHVVRIDCLWPGETAPGTVRTLSATLSARPGSQRAQTTFAPVAVVAGALPDSNVENNRTQVIVTSHPRISTQIRWIPPSSSAPEAFPPVDVLTSSERFKMPLAPAAPRADLIGYRLFRSTTPHVAPVEGNLIMEFGPSTTEAYVDGGFTGSFYVVTAVYAGGESAPSNEVSGGLEFIFNVPSVRVSDAKLRFTNNTPVAHAFRFELGGVPFAVPAKVKGTNGRYVYTQKGRLTNGESIADYRRRRGNRPFVITIRGPNESIITLVER